MRTVDFYFDFLSPYAYLASTRLRDMEKRHRVSFRCHVIDLVAARFAAGNTGPFNRDIPAKIRYLTSDLERWSRRYGVPLAFPKSFDSSRANRGFLWARKKNLADEYLAAAYTAIWGHGGDPAADSLLREVAATVGLPPEEFLLGLGSAEIAREYESENKQAQARGVFGVPIFIADDQMFWGNDRLDFLAEYLEDESRAVRS